VLEKTNVPRTTDQITPTTKAPDISNDGTMSAADHTANDDSISSNIDEEWSHNISLNKILLDTRNPTENLKS
jgi:hypothetical protein